jgi:hypothetical protein
MSIQQGLTNSFKNDILQGGQNIISDTLYMALYTSFASIGATTPEYTTDNEVSSDGTGYTAGGNLVTGATINTDVTTGTVYVNFDNLSWPDANFTARGALIYNYTTLNNNSVLVLDFGADKSFNAVNNTVVMPVNSSTTALIRLP